MYGMRNFKSDNQQFDNLLFTKIISNKIFEAASQDFFLLIAIIYTEPPPPSQES